MLDRLSLLIGLTVLAIAVLLGSIAIGRGIRDRGHTHGRHRDRFREE